MAEDWQLKAARRNGNESVNRYSHSRNVTQVQFILADASQAFAGCSLSSVHSMWPKESLDS